MKVLILGGSGMLGHKLWQTFATRFDTYTTFRNRPPQYLELLKLDASRAISGVSADNFESVDRVLAHLKPEVVVNCIGIVKQDAAGKDPIPSITINSLFPHRLAKAARDSGFRLIHLSTDCVFSGQTGGYSESAVPDAGDLYGRSKLLGEVTNEGCITIRTSMIGRELRGAHGLLEWFLAQKKSVRGFKRAIFSGFTTPALADVIAKIIAGQPDLTGTWHVAADPISKFDLLTLVKQTYGLAIEIELDESFHCDRSLDDHRFRDATGMQRPSWQEMIQNMRDDPTPYNDIRRMSDS